MAFNAIDNTRVNAAKHPDDWYADEVVAGKEQPYASLAVAYSKIPNAVRMKGKPFLVTEGGSTVEYWWKDDLENAIPKGVQSNDVSVKSTISSIRSNTGALRSNTFELSDSGKEGEIKYDPTDTTTPDDGILTFVTADGKRLKRIYDKTNIKASWGGISGTGTEQGANLQTLLNVVPDGSIIQFNSSETYLWSSNVSLLGKSISLFYNGSTWIKNTASTLLSYDGGIDWSKSVSILQVNELLESGTSNTAALRISMDLIPVGTKRGDVIKLTSEDMIYGSKPDEGDGKIGRMGQFMAIGKIDLVNNYIYTTGLPDELANYTTGLRAHKISDKALNIYDINLKTNVESAISGGWVLPYINIKNSISSKLYNIKSKDSYSPTIEGRGMFNPQVTALDVDTAYTDEAINRVGYGFRDIGCQYGQFNNLTGKSLRHLFTTNMSYINSGSDEISSYGRSAFSSINDSEALGCDNGSFDTHDGAWKITFNNCKSYGVYSGNASTGSAFTVRGHYITLNNCEGFGRQGLIVSEQYPNGTEGFVANNCKFSGSFRSFATGTASGGTNVDLELNNCKLECLGPDLYTGLNATIVMNDCEYKTLDGAFGRYFSGANSNITVNRGKLIDTFTGGKQFRVIFFDNNNTFFNINDLEIIASKSINILTVANSRTGGVSINNLKSNRPITEVLNTGDALGYFKQTIAYNVAEARSFSNIVDVNLATTTKINSKTILDGLIISNISYGGSGQTQGRILDDLDPGLFVGQVIQIRNTTSLYYIYLQNTTLVKTISGGNLMIKPLTDVSLVWDGVAWKEERVISPKVVQIHTGDSNIQVAAGTEVLILSNLNLTTNRAVTLRTPADFIGYELQIIPLNQSSSRWITSLPIYDASGSSTTQLKNGVAIKIIPNGSTWLTTSYDFGLNNFSAAGVDYTLTVANSILTLPVVTLTNRTASIPDALKNDGKFVFLNNENNANNLNWFLADGVAYYSDGTPLTSLPKQAITMLLSFKGRWVANIPQVKGSFRVITSATTLSSTDYGSNGELTVFLDASGGAFVLTLPTAATTVGLTTYVVKTDASANTPTVKGNGTELINNANTDTTLSTQNASFILKSNGNKHFKF